MNSTPYMDKQIMDLSQGSPAAQSKDFIDLMKHPEGEEEEVDHNTHHTLQIAGARMDGIDKEEEIVASYDFQPIRPVGVVAPPSQSPNFDATPVLAGRAWSSASDPKLNTTTVAAATATRNYGSLYSEPAEVILEKDRDAFVSPIVSEIDRTMKKHADNLLHVLEGVSARITQLESRTRNLESSVDNLKVSVGNNHGSTDGRLRQLENILREVQLGVQVLKDKQVVLGGEPGLAKLQTSEAEQQPETQNTVQVDSVQQAASVPQQYQQHLPSANNQQAVPALPPPNAPPQPSPPPNLPPSFQFPPQFLQNQIPSIPQHEPYFPPPGPPEAPNQQYQSSLTQQSYPPPAAPPHQQFQSGPQQQFSQPPPQLPQQRPSLAPANPPQLQPSLSHHAEEVPYAPQNYPPSLRQPPSGPPPSQQFYGAPSHMYESPSSRSSSGFSSGYGPPSGPTESYHYGGSPRYGGTSAVKPPLSSAAAQSGGTGYPQLPTARVLPQALPTASGVGSDSGSTGTGNRVPVDDVVDKVISMGFPRDLVRATVRKLTENGQSVDLNVVLDKLMNEGEGQPPRGWFGR